MTNIAYYRVSTKDQTIENQRLEVNKLYKIDKEFTDEAVSGTVKGKDREGFAAMMNYIREGDSLIVVDLDRLGRDSIDVQMNIQALKEKGVKVIITRMGFDLTTKEGELLVTIMSKVAEMERQKTMERAQAGRVRAKAEGKHLGRTAIVSPEEIKAAKDSGLSLSKVADKFGISVSSVQRGLKKASD